MTEISVTTLKCLYQDCLHEWTPRFPRLPAVCPKCKRYNWNTPYVGVVPKGGKGNVKKRKRPKSANTAIGRFQRQQILKHGGTNDDTSTREH